MVEQSVVDRDTLLRMFHALYGYYGEVPLAGHLEIPGAAVLAIQQGAMFVPVESQAALIRLWQRFSFLFEDAADPEPGSLRPPSVAVSVPGVPRPEIPDDPGAGSSARESPAVSVAPVNSPLSPAVPPAPPPDAAPPGPEAVSSSASDSYDEGPSANSALRVSEYSLRDVEEPLLDEQLAAEYRERRSSAAPAVQAVPAVQAPAPRPTAPAPRSPAAPAPPVASAAALVPVGGTSLTPALERKRQSLRNARALAVMTQFRLGMTYQEQLAALGLVTQIELALIHTFREAVPDPTKHWDAHRVDEEVQRRLARLRWVEREQEREHTGLRGAWNWLMGRGRITGLELFERMIGEADAMLISASDNLPSTPMDVVVQFTGFDTEV